MTASSDRRRQKVLISWAVSAALFILAAWPGWLSTDTLGMYRGATEGPIDDWFSPVLIYAWRVLGVESLGPVLPFLIQAALFWGALLTTALWLARVGVRHAWVLPPLAFAFESTWTLGWLWKDSALTGLLALACALGASLITCRESRARMSAWVAIGLLLGAAAAISWYMIPALAVALLGIAMVQPDLTRQRMQAGIAVGVGAATLATVLLFQALVIDPQPSYHAATPLLLDIARVECTEGTPATRSQGQSLLPPGLVRAKPGSDICASFTPYVIDPIFAWRDKDEPTTRVVVPGNADEMSALRRHWLSVSLANPALFAEGKLRQSVKFLISDLGSWWSPSKQLVAPRASIAIKGSTGDGSGIGWPSRGGLVLVATSSVTALASAAMLDFGSVYLGLLAILILPLGAGFIACGRGSWRPWLRMAPLLLFPMAWTLNMAFVAPAADFRYVVPAAVWGQLLVPLAIGLRKSGAFGASG